MYKKNILLILMLIISIAGGVVVCKSESKYNSAISNVEQMKRSELKIGDIVKTKGYFKEDDGGQAMYEIMSYDQWYELLSSDIKAISYESDGLGNPKLIKTPVDEYGNHTLDNGLVAKLITNNGITPEQWGAVGDGDTNDVYPFIHMFAQVKTGEINFNGDAVYSLGLTEGVDNPYRSYMAGALLGGQLFYKPIMGNVKDLKLNGNGCTITIPDNQWGDSGMGIFNFTGDIENLVIENFNFDGNCYNILDGNKTTNHTIFYAPGSLYASQLGEYKTEHYKYDETLEKNNDNMPFKKSSINTWTIRNCNFKNAGTMVNTQDSGGDFILLVNPEELDGLYIEDNTFINWGRWVFSIDLGGNGERLYNIKFNNNVCIQNDESSLVPYGQQRGLGLIDFESKKCFTNLEFKNNYINGVTGFAINGNSKVTENVNISNNTIIRPEFNYKSAYPYTFEFYSVQMKGLIFSNNDLSKDTGSIKLGYKLDNIKVENNKFSMSPFRILGLYGDIVFNNNTSIGKELVQVENVDCPDYITEKDDKYCNFIFINNIGGIGAHGGEAMFFDPNEPGKYSYIKLKIEDNKLDYMNIVAWDAIDFTFDTSQMSGENAFSVRGAKFIGDTYSLNSNPICGGGIYSSGEVITNNLNDSGVSRVNYYYDGEKLGINNFEKYSNNYSNYNYSKVICNKEGYLPMGGEFSYASSDIEYKPGLQVDKNTHIYTDSDLYMVCNDGILGEDFIEDDNKIISGDVYLVHLQKIAKINIEK